MKILVVGAGGQIASALQRLACSRGADVLALTHDDLDVTDELAVVRAVASYSPNYVINGAAFNAVDLAERNWRAAMRVNGLAPAFLALACKNVGSIFVHYSTDYVFDGTKSGPYDEQDVPSPLSTYGRSKLLGERAVLAIHERSYVLRTAWVFAPGHDNFVSRVLSAADEGRPLRFVDDVWSTPTYAADVAHATLELFSLSVPYGLYHAVGREACTPYRWASMVLGIARPGVAVEAVASSDVANRAKRPHRSVLSGFQLLRFGIEIPDGLCRLGEYFSGQLSHP